MTAKARLDWLLLLLTYRAECRCVGLAPIMEWPAPSRRSRYDPGLIIEGRTTAMEIATLGLDLGKRVVHVVGLDRAGSIVLRRRVSRDRVLTLTANLPRCVIGLEACCGAHHLGRNLTAQGHDVRLMPPEYVRPYVKNNKNDYRDGEAAAEAAGRPTMRFVPLKGEAQLDLQSLHRIREGLVARRTALINQVRALLLERGIAMPQGRRKLEQRLPEILADEQPACRRGCGIW
jgi:transposase